MSLALDVDDVVQVLLTDGKWYPVANNSFELDAYEYVWRVDRHTRPDHVWQDEKLTTIGFCFYAGIGDEWISGPLSAIQAVRTVRRDDDEQEEQPPSSEPGPRGPGGETEIGLPHPPNQGSDDDRQDEDPRETGGIS